MFKLHKKMNITVKKVVRELREKHGYQDVFIDEEIIKLTLKVIDEQLRMYKNISIKKS